MCAHILYLKLEYLPRRVSGEDLNAAAALAIPAS